MTQAKGDGTSRRGRGSCKGGGEGEAERVEEDSGTHKHDVFEKLHKNVVMIKGNRPGLRAAGINHSKHDMLP